MRNFGLLTFALIISLGSIAFSEGPMPLILKSKTGQTYKVTSILWAAGSSDLSRVSYEADSVISDPKKLLSQAKEVLLLVADDPRLNNADEITVTAWMPQTINGVRSEWFSKGICFMRKGKAWEVVPEGKVMELLAKIRDEKANAQTAQLDSEFQSASCKDKKNLIVCTDCANYWRAPTEYLEIALSPTHGEQKYCHLVGADSLFICKQPENLVVCFEVKKSGPGMLSPGWDGRDPKFCAYYAKRSSEYKYAGTRRDDRQYYCRLLGKDAVVKQ